MDNITGNPVTDRHYLKSRLFLVKELMGVLKKSSVVIEAPRRFGKTSVIKEFVRQQKEKSEEKRRFNTLFLELEGEETINDFCFLLFKELLELYHIKKKIESFTKRIADSWNMLATCLKKIKVPGFEMELAELTRNYTLPEWKDRIDPLLAGLNAFDKKTVIIFDEFPDMLLNFKKNAPDETQYKNTTDSLMAWLRSLRQTQDESGKYRFVFCGSIHLRKTLEAIGISKRINDLEAFVIPPINREDARLLISKLSKRYKLQIEPEGAEYMVDKIESGSLYYGQILVKALRETGENSFSYDKIKAIYETMLRRGNHDLNHYHSRLETYLTSIEKECSNIILERLCSTSIHETELYQLFLAGKCSRVQFQSVVARLIYEGYIVSDINDEGKLKFVSPILKDWWACKAGVADVCL